MVESSSSIKGLTFFRSVPLKKGIEAVPMIVKKTTCHGNPQPPTTFIFGGLVHPYFGGVKPFHGHLGSKGALYHGFCSVGSFFGGSCSNSILAGEPRHSIQNFIYRTCILKKWTLWKVEIPVQRYDLIIFLGVCNISIPSTYDRFTYI